MSAWEQFLRSNLPWIYYHELKLLIGLSKESIKEITLQAELPRVGSKIIRAFDIIHVKKLIPNAFL